MPVLRVLILQRSTHNSDNTICDHDNLVDEVTYGCTVYTSGGARTNDWMEILDGELKCTIDGKLGDFGHDSEHKVSVGLETLGVIQHSELFNVVCHSEL